MTSREELIALDRDSLEQQVIHLQQKLESAQFERGQERARAEKAESACAELRDVCSNLADIAQNNDISEPEWNGIESLKAHGMSVECGKGWISPEKRKLAVEALEALIPFAVSYSSHPKRNPKDALVTSMGKGYEALAALKESQ